MAAEGPISEALSRLEHKVDLVLDIVARLVGPDVRGSWMLTQVGEPSHTCPVCTQPVQYLVDIMNKVITRKCGCSTGKQAPVDLAALAPPALMPRLENTHGGTEGDQDGRDAGRGKR